MSVDQIKYEIRVDSRPSAATLSLEPLPINTPQPSGAASLLLAADWLGLAAMARPLRPPNYFFLRRTRRIRRGGDGRPQFIRHGVLGGSGLRWDYFLNVILTFVGG